MDKHDPDRDSSSQARIQHREARLLASRNRSTHRLRNRLLGKYFPELRVGNRTFRMPLRIKIKTLAKLALGSSAGRCVGLILLAIPAKRRDEFIGDFHESLSKARAAGYGRIALFVLSAVKLLLYVWISLKFRASDFARREEEQDQLETPD